MKREEIKTYKDACKVIGRKPRTYLVLGRLITNFKTLSKWKMI